MGFNLASLLSNLKYYSNNILPVRYTCYRNRIHCVNNFPTTKNLGGNEMGVILKYQISLANVFMVGISFAINGRIRI